MSLFSPRRLVQPFLLRWIVCAIAVASIGLGVPVTVNAVSQIAVTGDVFTSLNNGTTKTPNTVNIVTNPNGSKTGTQSGSQSDFFTFGLGLTQSFTGIATASAEAFADEGVLRLRATANATASPTAYVAPFPGALGNNPFEPVAVSSFGVSFGDNMVLTDPTGTLAFGSPVEYRVTVVVDSTVSGDYSSALSIAAGLRSNPQVGGSFSRATNYQFSFRDHFVFSSVVSGKIGETHTFGVFFAAGANASASFTRGRENQSSFFDAQNTVTGNLDVLTPGLVLLTESGHDYRLVPAPVPVPGALLLLGSGVVSVAARVRRRVKSPSRSAHFE